MPPIASTAACATHPAPAISYGGRLRLVECDVFLKQDSQTRERLPLRCLCIRSPRDLVRCVVHAQRTDARVVRNVGAVADADQIAMIRHRLLHIDPLSGQLRARRGVERDGALQDVMPHRPALAIWRHRLSNERQQQQRNGGSKGSAREH